ncbi:thiamine diphosphokinase [Clostridium tarantellae]|uniref:Thiamine diphosphokinase n=1 Tax=Clostridium tarantellae TaxID=39493 RepID=A0A6I1MHU4_9CLOT|nr:thiamine diphosphokinase [Clostridium tarantellae]MPQ42444.1 thiamine diphosphokinase [Clostridium tarantellae]
MNIAIISGGKRPKKSLLNEIVRKSNCIIAADKGIECLIDEGITPDYILGDFDSVNIEYLEKLEKLENYEMIKYNVEKDNTDSEIAVNKAIELGANVIYMLGFTGTRIDHVLANIGLLNKCLENNIEAYIIDENNKIFLTDVPRILLGNPGETVSFQAFGENVNNFSIHKAKYELEGHNLKFGDALCVSNEFVTNEIGISFDKGKVLIIYSRD